MARSSVVTPDGADRVVHAEIGGFPICIYWDVHDRLLIVDGAHRRILGRRDDGFEPVADLSAVSDAPWNEIVTHPSGRAFVNGIGYDMRAGDPATAPSGTPMFPTVTAAGSPSMAPSSRPSRPTADASPVHCRPTVPSSSRPTSGMRTPSPRAEAFCTGRARPTARQIGRLGPSAADHQPHDLPDPTPQSATGIAVPLGPASHEQGG